jgi:hypothetical protein
VTDRTTSDLAQALTATPECVPVERFAETLSGREQQHVEGCARCQSELALWREFEESHAAADEGAAVQWIVAELGRRRRGEVATATPGPLAWLTPAFRRWAAAAGAIAVITTGAYLVSDREPAPRELSTPATVYRANRLEVRGPVGDLASAPAAIEWVASPDAVSYDIEVFEVDRTPLWRTTSVVSHVELPPSVVRQLLPGKAVLWEVRARNAASQVIAESGTQQFRVAVTAGSPKD